MIRGKKGGEFLFGKVGSRSVKPLFELENERRCFGVGTQFDECFGRGKIDDFGDLSSPVT